ncbi:hypothetical protein IJE86_04425 [bacterium]|nr:hypothetical protein [bacterium]
MVKIIAPEKGYRGLVSGIVFTDGIGTAEIDAFTKEWFLSKGYTIEEIEDNTPAATSETGAPAGNPEKEEVKPLTKAELTKIATDLGIEVKSKATNAEIEKLIADKKAELEALSNNDGNPETGNPETGAPAGNPESGELGNEDPEKGE